jgi:hypothetical protein
MNLTLIAALTAAGLFFGMLIFLEIGRRTGIRRLARDPDGLPKGAGAAEAAVFGLLGLIIAFSFSGAASRLEDRRHLIAEEANAIGTAYLRIDLLSGNAQPEMRELFRRYLDLRLETYRNIEDLTDTQAKLTRTAELQREIWTKALTVSRSPESPTSTAMLLLPALNAMIDITTTRVMAAMNHPPLVVFLLLGGLSLIGSLLVGYAMSGNKKRCILHMLAFVAMMSLAIYVIIDLEYPRLGLIRVDAADQVLIDLRKSMQ